jgi:hypothetical protein
VGLQVSTPILWLGLGRVRLGREVKEICKTGTASNEWASAPQRYAWVGDEVPGLMEWLAETARMSCLHRVLLDRARLLALHICAVHALASPLVSVVSDVLRHSKEGSGNSQCVFGSGAGLLRGHQRYWPQPRWA